MSLFHDFVYKPLYNILIYLYDVMPLADFGLSIILTTIIIKIAIIPLSKKQIESQKQMQELQPKIKEIQKKYKNDKEKQTKELMQFYKDNKVNPFGGCVPLIIQLIIFIAMYKVLLDLYSHNLVVNINDLYSFVKDPGSIGKMSAGIIDLSIPNPILAVLTAVAQYYQTKMIMVKNKNLEAVREKESQKDEKKEEKKEDFADFAEIMSKQMLYIGPFLMLFIGLQFAAGLTLYWFTSIVFTIMQQSYIMKFQKKNPDIK